ncbi:von Willebrand factor A domain-containing protein 5A-like [Alosa pseudoharengus]|uniref:von Willebrand factor A domain-containing protein 5A-like n=1 Tax=Alosa pseudoharengus TaxID=34774 RepID=UPI003F89B39D
MQADDALRFCLPAVLNPRYTPQDMDRSQMATVTSVPAGTVPYTLALSAHLSSPQPISKVESNCDLEPLAYLNPDKTQATVSLSPGHLFDRDVELLLYYHDAHKPTAIVEAGLDTAEPGSLMRDPVVLLSIYPEFPCCSNILTFHVWRVYFCGGPIREYGLRNALRKRCKDAHRECQGHSAPALEEPPHGLLLQHLWLWLPL